MYSVLCYNFKDASYSVIDWNDFKVDRLSAKELYKCIKKLHFDVRGMDSAQSVYDSSFSYRKLLDNLVLIEMKSSDDANSNTLQVKLYDRSTGQMKFSLVSLNFNKDEGTYKVEKAYYNVLDSSRVCVQVVLSQVRRTSKYVYAFFYRYFYVFDRDIKSVLFSDVYYGGTNKKPGTTFKSFDEAYKLDIKFDTSNKTIIVDGNPVYNWR